MDRHHVPSWSLPPKGASDFSQTGCINRAVLPRRLAFREATCLKGITSGTIQSWK